MEGGVMVTSTGRLFAVFTTLLAAPASVFAAEAVFASKAVEATTGEFYLLALGLAVIGITGLILIRKQSSLL
jgi:hypothetical protein